MSWFICTISKEAPRNWELCKQVGLYGIPGTTARRRPEVEVGDRLLVWQGGAGYIAEATVTGPVRIPASKAEAPWPGGTYRFAYIVPIEVTVEVQSPLKVPFVGDKQAGTGFSKVLFRRSFVLVSDKAARHVSRELLEKRDKELVGD